jgi:hypothetical protein
MSVSFDQMFPSKYLKADDLEEGTMMVTISSLDQEQMRDGTTKFVLSFVGQKKGLVLNKTNGKSLSKAFGKNSAAWIGMEVQLYPVAVDFQGESTTGIRLRLPALVTAAELDDPIPAY